MTKRKHLKRRVRERATKTGESYAAAFRHLRARDKEKPMSATETLVSCSFCGKNQKMVKKLIAGPGVYICDECIALCDDILAGEAGHESQPAPSLEDAPVEHLLTILAGMATTARSFEANLSRWVKRLHARGASLDALATAVGVSGDEVRQRFSL
jgi:hypothetical protein